MTRSLLQPLILACIAFTPLTARCQQAVDAENGDYAKVEKDHANLGGWRHQTMQQQPLLPDGSRGYTVAFSTGGANLGISDERLAPFRDREEYGLYNIGCDSQAVVVATLEGTEGHLSKNRETIYTRFHFTVQSIIKEGPGVALGSNIDVIQLGGTVIDQGETLRVNVADESPYRLHQSYLLFLLHDQRASMGVFTSPQAIRIQVVSDRILKLPGIYDPSYIHNGETPANFQLRFSEAMQKIPCAAR